MISLRKLKNTFIELEERVELENLEKLIHFSLKEMQDLLKSSFSYFPKAMSKFHKN